MSLAPAPEGWDKDLEDISRTLIITTIHTEYFPVLAYLLSSCSYSSSFCLLLSSIPLLPSCSCWSRSWDPRPRPRPRRVGIKTSHKHNECITSRSSSSYSRLSYSCVLILLLVGIVGNVKLVVLVSVGYVYVLSRPCPSSLAPGPGGLG